MEYKVLGMRETELFVLLYLGEDNELKLSDLLVLEFLFPILSE
jgi:hypothetical protein